MPWCPKCKNEFQEGYTLCSDCKVELVEKLPEVEEFIPFFQSDTKNIADKLSKFFTYSDLKSVVRYNNELGVYIVFVPSDKRKVAQKLYQAFYFVERERYENGLGEEASEEPEEMNEAMEDFPEEEASEEVWEASEDAEDVSEEVGEASEDAEDALEESKQDESEPLQDSAKLVEGDALYRDTWLKKSMAEAEDIAEPEEEETEKIESGTYVLKSEKYKDYNSTVSVFLGLGILGVIFVILNAVGVLTILNGILPICVMGTLFLSFIVIGITTEKKAKELQLEIEDEKNITKQINEWLSTNVTADYLESLGDETISAELNYIRVTDTIREKLQENFPGQSSAFLDRLIEEFYNANFDTEEV